MKLTPAQKTIIERIVNAFETGRPQGDYGAIAIFNDGPHGIRQLTYGRSQTTEYGKLRQLITRYAAAGGTYSKDLGAYEDRIGAEPLTDDRPFRSLLRIAARTDPVMRDVQDTFFEKEYFLPAMQWVVEHGLTFPLSALVVYDSYIHSGSILPLIRRTFPERTPDAGGDERAWTTAYVKARHTWLIEHPRAHVRKTQYRTRCLWHEIQRANWHLAVRPIRANGVVVYGAPASRRLNVQASRLRAGDGGEDAACSAGEDASAPLRSAMSCVHFTAFGSVARAAPLHVPQSCGKPQHSHSKTLPCSAHQRDFAATLVLLARGCKCRRRSAGVSPAPASRSRSR